MIDASVKSQKTAILSFRAERKFSEIPETFLVAALFEMTELDFLRDHHD